MPSLPPANRSILHPGRLADAAMEHYERLADALPAAGLTLAVVIFLMVFPQITIFGYHFEEGLTVSLARDVLDGGNPWYEPYHYGQRWMERPVLLSWIIAVLSMPFGEVYPVVARFPVVCAVYGGALTVFWILRDMVSRPAAFFGAACFLYSIMMFPRVVTAESDIAVTSVQFVAVALWWRGYRTGRNELWRWIAIGLLLGATGLFKGPQPPGFFALGVGAFLLWRRDWRSLPGFALAGAISLTMVGSWYVAVYRDGDLGWWIYYMRLDRAGTVLGYLSGKASLLLELIENLLPGLLLAVAGFVAGRRFWPDSGDRSSPRELFVALGFFVLIGSVLALLWPGWGRPRYAAPALPAVAVMAGLTYDFASGWMRNVLRLAFVNVAAMMLYVHLANLIAVPAFPDHYSRRRLDAEAIRAVIASNPAPLHAQLRVADRLLGHIYEPIAYESRTSFFDLKAPAWVLASEGWLVELQERRPDLLIEPHVLRKIGKKKADLALVKRRDENMPAAVPVR